MADYTSNSVRLHGSAEEVFSRLSRPSALKDFLGNVPLDQIPEDKRAVLDNITLTEDSVVINGGPTGSMTLKADENHSPDYIRYEGVGLPVRLGLVFRLTPESGESCSATVTVEADIPAMLRPMIGGTLQKAADQFAQMLATIPSWS